MKSSGASSTCSVEVGFTAAAAQPGSHSVHAGIAVRSSDMNSRVTATSMRSAHTTLGHSASVLASAR